MKSRPLVFALVLSLLAPEARAADEAPAEAKSSVNWRKVAIAPTVVGAVGLIGGLTLVVVSRASPRDPRVGNGVPVLEGIGWTALGVGLGLIAVGALTCALSDTLKVSLAVAPSSGGGTLALSGSF